MVSNNLALWTLISHTLLAGAAMLSVTLLAVLANLDPGVAVGVILGSSGIQAAAAAGTSIIVHSSSLNAANPTQ